MRAVFRYRRIPFIWKPQSLLGTQIFDSHFPNLRARVIPVIIRPDNSYANDSTPLILELEQKFKFRKILPQNSGLAFLTLLVEDFADEWLTKVMFEGRFHTEKDARFGARWQLLQFGADTGIEGDSQTEDQPSPTILKKVADQFASRQVSRRKRIVGHDWAAGEKCLRRVCEIITDMVIDGQPFLFGNYPTVADFGLYGQLRQLVTDPFPARIMAEYPIAYAYVWKIDDLSGYVTTVDTPERPESIAPAVVEILRLASKTYIPFMMANSQALKNGEHTVAVDIFDGEYKHSQPPFKYQGLCLKTLTDQYNMLQGEDLVFVNKVLDETGCLDLFSAETNQSKL